MCLKSLVRSSSRDTSPFLKFGWKNIFRNECTARPWKPNGFWMEWSWVELTAATNYIYPNYSNYSKSGLHIITNLAVAVRFSARVFFFLKLSIIQCIINQFWISAKPQPQFMRLRQICHHNLLDFPSEQSTPMRFSTCSEHQHLKKN